MTGALWIFIEVAMTSRWRFRSLAFSISQWIDFCIQTRRYSTNTTRIGRRGNSDKWFVLTMYWLSWNTYFMSAIMKRRYTSFVLRHLKTCFNNSLERSVKLWWCDMFKNIIPKCKDKDYAKLSMPIVHIYHELML